MVRPPRRASRRRSLAWSVAASGSEVAAGTAGERTNGSTTHAAARPVGDRLQWRDRLDAAWLGERTARGERAAGRSAIRRRRLAADDAEVGAALGRVGQAVEQAARVRMTRRGEQFADRPRLDDAPGVEHVQRVGQRRHHPEVVADQQHGHVAARGAADRSAAGCPLGPSRRGRSSARRRSAAWVRRRGRWRWRCAGASRRRTGAGSWTGRARGRAGAPSSSSSIARSRACAAESPRCTSTCSVSCRPTLSIGCSDVIGSWKTTATWCPRMRRSRDWLIFSTS